MFFTSGLQRPGLKTDVGRLYVAATRPNVRPISGLHLVPRGFFGETKVGDLLPARLCANASASADGEKLFEARHMSTTEWIKMLELNYTSELVSYATIVSPTAFVPTTPRMTSITLLKSTTRPPSLFETRRATIYNPTSFPH